MKSKFWLGLVLGALISAFLLISWDNFQPGFAAGNVKEYVVSLEVKKNLKKIKIRKNREMPCSAGSVSKYGCLDVAVGEEAKVRFELSDTSFFVSEMIICKGKNKAKQNCNLSPAEIQEFAVTKTTSNKQYHPDEKGVISFKLMGGRLTEFDFIDVNSFEGEYFYTIKACPDSNIGSQCIDSDPGIKNGGKQLHD